MEMYDDIKHIKDTFTEENLSQYLLQAQWAEFIELKKAIHVIYKIKKSPLRILDIGIGDARIIKHLSKIDEIWNAIEKYDGIDIAQNCIDISNKTIKDLNLEGKVDAKLLNALDLNEIKDKYDMIISTRFTAGNFYPSNFDFKKFSHGEKMLKNDKFTTIFKKAYNLLNEKGELIIGSAYIDNENTRKKQEDSYRSFGWTITSNKEDCFTSTEEGWWSQRYTKEKIYKYLDFIPKENFLFLPLDTYDYAMMIRIKK